MIRYKTNLPGSPDIVVRVCSICGVESEPVDDYTQCYCDIAEAGSVGPAMGWTHGSEPFTPGKAMRLDYCAECSRIFNKV